MHVSKGNIIQTLINNMDGLIKGIFLFNLCRESFHKTTFADVVDIN